MWPVTLALAAPGARELEQDVSAADRWIRSWRTFAENHPHAELRWRQVTSRIGKQAVPSHLEVPDPGTLAALTGNSDHWEAATAWASAVSVTPTGLRTLVRVPVEEIETVLAVATWLKANPRSGLMARQLPIEGIGTKWISGRYAALALLVGAADHPKEDDDRLTALGLRRRPEYVRLAVLDPALRGAVGGMRDIAVESHQLSDLSWRPSRVVVIENLETAVTLPDLDETVVIHSLGHNVEPLRDLRWVREAPRLVYWGDLDAAGLTILNRVRSLGLPARSILMDEATLRSHRRLAVSEDKPPKYPRLTLLSADEAAAYEGLQAGRWGPSLRLEQERIPLQVAVAALRRAVELS
ncbi:Wadjet anti-phage system protein JetD domain-containing protein [Cellulomonas soli]